MSKLCFAVIILLGISVSIVNGVHNEDSIEQIKRNERKPVQNSIYKITIPQKMFNELQNNGGFEGVNDVTAVLSDDEKNVVLSVYSLEDYKLIISKLKSSNKTKATYKIILTEDSFNYFNVKSAFKDLAYELNKEGQDVTIVFDKKDAYNIARKRLDAIQKASSGTIYKLKLTTDAYKYFKKRNAFKGIDGEIVEGEYEVILEFTNKDSYDKILSKIKEIKAEAAGGTTVSEYKIQLSYKSFRHFKRKDIFKGFRYALKKKGRDVFMVFKEKHQYEGVLKALKDARATKIIDNSDKDQINEEEGKDKKQKKTKVEFNFHLEVPKSSFYKLTKEKAFSGLAFKKKRVGKKIKMSFKDQVSLDKAKEITGL